VRADAVKDAVTGVGTGAVKDAPADAPTDREALAAWLADEVGEPVVIGELKRTSAGFSRENWVLDATWGGARHDLIVRRDPVGSVLNTDRRVEVTVLRAMAETDVPVPRLRWADVEGTRLGRPAVVMDLVRGVCDGFVLNGGRPLEERVALAHTLYDLLAAIHRVDVSALPLEKLEDPGPTAALAAVEHWEAELHSVQLEPQPELAFVFAWLRAHAPANARTTLVHGDFKPGNALLDGDEWTAVLDWETAHLGDPHEDLGWVTNPLRQGEHRIPGAWEPADLLQRWSDRTGWPVDADAVRWWQVLANVKLSVIVLTGTRAFVEGRLDRVHQTPVRIYQLLLDQIGA
jgi:aminoglycoside phosphotransferase (APT) family kinase protein